MLKITVGPSHVYLRPTDHMKFTVSFLLLLSLFLSPAWGNGPTITVTNGKTVTVINDDIDLGDPRIRAMTVKANQILADIAGVCSKWHLDNDGAAHFQPDSASDDDKFYQSLGTSGIELMQWAVRCAVFLARPASPPPARPRF